MKNFQNIELAYIAQNYESDYQSRDGEPYKQRPPPTADGIHAGRAKITCHYPEEQRPSEFAFRQFAFGRCTGGKTGDSRHIENNKRYYRGNRNARTLYHSGRRKNLVGFPVDISPRDHCGERTERGNDVFLCHKANTQPNERPNCEPKPRGVNSG